MYRAARRIPRWGCSPASVPSRFLRGSLGSEFAKSSESLLSLRRTFCHLFWTWSDKILEFTRWQNSGWRYAHSEHYWNLVHNPRLTRASCVRAVCNRFDRFSVFTATGRSLVWRKALKSVMRGRYPPICVVWSQAKWRCVSWTNWRSAESVEETGRLWYVQNLRARYTSWIIS